MRPSLLSRAETIRLDCLVKRRYSNWSVTEARWFLDLLVEGIRLTYEGWTEKGNRSHKFWECFIISQGISSPAKDFTLLRRHGRVYGKARETKNEVHGFDTAVSKARGWVRGKLAEGYKVDTISEKVDGTRNHARGNPAKPKPEPKKIERNDAPWSKFF